MQSTSFTLDFSGKTLTAEFTDLTDQANGSVLLKLGETAILVTATMSDRDKDMPYFPLSVEFEEKFYAAGAILGSRFQRREGRPSDEAVLSARIIDRSIRPLFDHTIRKEIQVVVTVLAMGDDDPDVLGIIGASLALGVSNIPWDGPVNAVRIGRRKSDGEILINPGYAARAEDQLAFEVLACGKNGKINMIEAAAEEVSEPDILAVLQAATSIHSHVEQWQKNIIRSLGDQKYVLEKPIIPTQLAQLFETQFKETLQEVTFSNRPGKDHIYDVKHTFVATATELGVAEAVAGEYFETKISLMLHDGAIYSNVRADGRTLDEIRPLYAKAGGISPVLHGSGIFYRGGTHIFSALTLGGPEAAQQLDTIEDRDTKKRFLHHYNFPPYSVGETGRVGGFNRRMIGHGALAEKALRPMIPTQAVFPYTIRLVSETMASNGSSSMGAVCASTIALMDGGVPITRPVAGIASGVMISGEKFAVLTDIQGPEDEFGDMDCKVAGTTEGITAMQMDVKVDGIPLHILQVALEKTKAARLHILETIETEISHPRNTISSRAPEIITLQINPDQIGLVIGGGGKTINKIKAETGVEEISIEDTGHVFITGANGTAQKAQATIAALTKTYTVGERLMVTVVKIASFGAFARLDEYHEGLIHVSEIAPYRIERVTDVLSEGEIVEVVVSKVADGKIGLSIREIDPEFAKRKGINNPEPVKN